MAGYGYIPNSGKNKWVWTKEEDTMLVDSLMELHVSGKYVNADIKPEYVHAVLGLMDPKVVSSAKAVKTRMKTLKINVHIMHDLLVGKYMSGFSWDFQTSCVIADNQVWDGCIKTHREVARFRNRSFPHYNKLCTIFGISSKDRAMCFQKNAAGGEAVVEENQISPCVESENLQVGEDAGSTHGVIEGVRSKRKRDEEKDLSETCVESLEKLKNIIESFTGGNVKSNAANDMDKVMTQMENLSGLTLDERLIAMSVIGRSAPLAKMFDWLDGEGKLRMAQLVANGSIR